MKIERLNKLNGISEGKLNQFIRFFIICASVSTLAYIVLISNELTNTYDGMWQGSYYTDYGWVI